MNDLSKKCLYIIGYDEVYGCYLHHQFSFPTAV